MLAPQGMAPPAGGEEPVYGPSTATLTPTITADITTNTLIIQAPPAQLELVKSLLNRLDCMPPQVYIEAIIAGDHPVQGEQPWLPVVRAERPVHWNNGQKTTGSLLQQSRRRG